MNKKRFVLLMALFHGSWVSATTLEEAWQAARLHSAQYRSADYARLAAQEIPQQTRAQLLPQLSASAEHRRFSEDRGAYSQDLRIQVNQPLLDRPRWQAHEEAQLSAEQANSEFNYQDSQLRLNVSKAYLAILSSREKLKAVAAEQLAYRQQIERAKALFESGEATILDTYEAEASLDEAIAKELRFKTEKILAENQYRDLTGLSPEWIQDIGAKTLPDFTFGTQENEWIDKALNQNSALKVQSLLVDKSQRALDRAEAEYWPQLNLTAGYQDSRSYRYGSKQQHDGAYIGLSFTIPIYSGGDTDSKIRQNKALLARQQTIFEGERDQLRLQIKQAWAILQGQKAQIQAQEQLLKSQMAKLDATRLGRSYGIRHSMDEIQAAQAYAEAQEKLATARYAYLEAWLTLLHLSGELVKVSHLTIY